MHEPTLLRHAIRRGPDLVRLIALAWAPAALLVVSIALLGGSGALRASVFATVVALHVAIAVGHALAVPAMLRVLHTDDSIRAAIHGARLVWPLNAAIASITVPVSLLAVMLWPEIWGTVSEVVAVQVLAAGPIVLACQLAWMQQVADGVDAPTVAHDTWWLVRHSARDLLLALVPAYAVLFGLLAANLLPIISGPLALSLVTIPFTAWTWRTWCHVTGARPVWDEPVRVARASSAQDGAATGATAQAAGRVAPILLGGGAPARLQLTTTPGVAEGAWLHLESGDSFTATVRVADGRSREWAVYLWRPGGQWRELAQLWNDGEILIAHGVCWGERAYLAIARRDGAVGVPFTAWVCVSTQAATTEQPESGPVAA